MKNHEEKEQLFAVVVIAREVTDEEIVQRMDRHARNAAAGIISPKPIYKEIPARDMRQRTS